MTTAQTTSFERLQSQISVLENENKYLREQIEWFKRNIFGKRSEKIPEENHNQLEFDGFGNLEVVEKVERKTVSSHERKKPKKNGQDKIKLPEDIPTVVQVIDIPESEKVCKVTGKPLVKIGEEITQKLAYKPGSYYLKKIVRLKYATPGSEEQGITIAPLPESLLIRCFAHESFLADVMVKKYADHQPLYRQSEILSRQGVIIKRQQLCNWVFRAGQALKPLYDLMKKHLLESENIFVDESPVKMQAPGKGKTQEAYCWVAAGGKSKDPPYRIYQFFGNRKHINVEKLIENYRGVLHSDKYGAYETLAKQKKIIWCPCWVHIRRNFFEAESGDPEFRKWILRKIRYLFMLEKVAWARSPEERLRIRKEKEEPIIDEITKAVKAKLISGKLLPKSKLRKALGYYCGLEAFFKNYLQHPFARMDNNVVERAIRPLAIGRKNWLFIGNLQAGESAGIILSLVQTCRGLAINPQEYLEDVMIRLMSHPVNKLHELLPDQWALKKGK